MVALITTANTKNAVMHISIKILPLNLIPIVILKLNNAQFHRMKLISTDFSFEKHTFRLPPFEK